MLLYAKSPRLALPFCQRTRKKCDQRVSKALKDSVICNVLIGTVAFLLTLGRDSM
jgi:hypothetical protein